jgi:Resolvase, N terminal domain
MAEHMWVYARVSTRDQNPQLQLDALAEHGYDTLVMEKESGKRGTARPEWEDLLGGRPLPHGGRPPGQARRWAATPLAARRRPRPSMQPPRA